MFQVKRIDRKDDNTIYNVYNVHTKHGFMFFLLNAEGNLMWADSRQFIPIIQDSNQWPHHFIEKENHNKHTFYAVESVENREPGDLSTHYLIYYCSGCNKWHRIDKRDCIIE